MIVATKRVRWQCELVEALQGLLIEHQGMNRQLHAIGRGRVYADDGAHPDAPAVIARDVLQEVGALTPATCKALREAGEGV